MGKQSRYQKSWCRRHFVLTGQFLCSFKHFKDYRNPTEVIRLAECSTVKSCEEEVGKDNAFRVEAGGRSYYLIAETTEEKESWIGYIGRAMVRPTVMVQKYD